MDENTITVVLPDGKMEVPKGFIETSEFYKGLVEVFEDGIPETLELGGDLNKEVMELALEVNGEEIEKIYSKYGQEKLVKLIKSLSFLQHTTFIKEKIIPAIASFINSDIESEEKDAMLNRMMEIANAREKY
jgi:hypothetical protein